MFKFRKAGSQARRKLVVAEPISLRWRKSYNWLLAALPLIAGVGYLNQTDDLLPIRRIQLLGTFENLDRAEVEAALRPYMGRGFFSLDIQELQQTLHAKAWTDAVSVRRVWPDKIRVTIVEKKPVARWDERHLLSDRAKVFVADTGPFGHLPRVHAANHRPEWVLDRYYRLDERFDSVDERLIALEVDSRGALDVELINGLGIRLGRSDIERKIERLITIYRSQILPRRERIQRLDLRYSNGFAVTWKKEALRERDEASIWSNNNV